MAKTSNRTSGRRARRSASEWREEVAAWRASGLSAREYANGRGLHAGTLMGWASRLGRGTRAVEAKTRLSRSSFVPVRVFGGESPQGEELSAEIVLSGGRSVRLSGALRLGQLAELLDAVEGRRGC